MVTLSLQVAVDYAAFGLVLQALAAIAIGEFLHEAALQHYRLLI